MEQDAATLAASGAGAPGSAGNGAGDGGTAGPDSGSPDTPSQSPAPPTEPWKAHGFDSFDKLIDTHRRNQERVTGFEREMARLRSEQMAMQRENEVYKTQFQTLQPLLTKASAPEAVSTKYISSQEGFDAYLNGNQEIARAYDEQQRRLMDRPGGMTPQDVQKAVVDTFTALSKPLTITQRLESKFPELKDTKSEFYHKVYDRLATEARDPYYQMKYPTDPMLQTTWNHPDGFGQLQADWRLIEDVAKDVKLESAIEQGRREEASRRDAPNLAGSGTAGKQPSSSSDNTPLLTTDERQFIHEHLPHLPQEWGKTEEAVAKYRWDKLLTPQEKNRRIALKREGQWK